MKLPGVAIRKYTNVDYCMIRGGGVYEFHESISIRETFSLEMSIASYIPKLRISSLYSSTLTIHKNFPPKNRYTVLYDNV